MAAKWFNSLDTNSNLYTYSLSLKKVKFLHYAFVGSGAVNTATEYKIEACLKFPT